MAYFNQMRWKSIGKFLRGFLPSQHVLIVILIFYVGGVVFTLLDLRSAQFIFNGGFLLGNLEVQITPPSEISWNYFLNQFVYYLGGAAWNIFRNNLEVSLECIFTGIMIIPSILVGLFSFIGAVCTILSLKVGVIKAALIMGGCFHIYFEFLAGALVIEAFLKFYGSILRSVRNRSFTLFKQDMRSKFIPILLRIIFLLAVGAVLEVFWSTWWVYILTNHYVSWVDFYFGVNSALVH
ncbi:MAG: hypothetical protein A4E27_01248 [Methanobacterium sp. PtaU1.Bin242]|nr:MAG: hypothetical protein A4E27_01248 [Methanobacterium sp. PtaU1.Bin242]